MFTTVYGGLWHHTGIYDKFTTGLRHCHVINRFMTVINSTLRNNFIFPYCYFLDYQIFWFCLFSHSCNGYQGYHNIRPKYETCLTIIRNQIIFAERCHDVEWILKYLLMFLLVCVCVRTCARACVCNLAFDLSYLF